jgi:histidinol-phosphatase
VTETPTHTLTDDLTFAQELADAADLISRDRFRANDLHISTKADSSHVTDADQAVERAIRELIAQRRPGDGILGEEYGTSGSVTRQWIIDPIDGTANFMRGVPVWGTLISLAIDGVPVVGVVSSPALGRRWWAARGHGAWTEDTSPHAPASEPRALHVSGIADLADASLSYNNLNGWDAAGHFDSVVALTRAVWRSRAYGEMWSYMLLAEGALEIVGEYDLKPYDMAALIPIIEEAGGRFTSADGEDGPWHGSALATNGAVHDATLALLHRGV